MQVITVERYKSNGDTTLSRVFVNGIFQCYGLEDEYRTVKVYGETRIPAGTYNVALRTEGGFHNRYSKNPALKDIHRGMLWVQDVPGFEWILIHIGNTDKDTAGCLVVGAARDEGKMILYNSRVAYRALYTAVVQAAAARKLSITYVDNDKPKGKL